MSMIELFVYGSLRHGGVHWQNHLAPAVGISAVTDAAYTMRSRERVPIVERGGDTAITGELFDVDAETLAAIDRLEGHPNWYTRVEIDVHLASGEVRRAWIYLMTPGQHEDSAIIASGDWCCRG